MAGQVAGGGAAAAPRKRQRLSAQARRAAILDVAEPMFAELGFAEVSTVAIARECGISEGLVFHHFGSKAEVYAGVVTRSEERLTADAQRLLDALPVNTPVREQVRGLVELYLDHVAARPLSWAAVTRGDTPPEVQYVRTDIRDQRIDGLTSLLPGNPRTAIAVPGFLGFIDAVALDWVDEGCPVDTRLPIVEAALGALEGALGDWG